MGGSRIFLPDPVKPGQIENCREDLGGALSRGWGLYAMNSCNPASKHRPDDLPAGEESSQGPKQLGETAFPISRNAATIHSYLEMPHSHRGNSRSLLKIFVTRICIYIPFVHPSLSQIKLQLGSVVPLDSKGSMKGFVFF